MNEIENVVTNAADAQRVADAAQLAAEILLREDPRVRAAFDRWRALMVFLESNAPDADHGLNESIRLLVTVVQEIGQAQYRWLPQLLLFEFGREWEQQVSGAKMPPFLTLEVPEGVTWATTKPRPKSKATKVGARLENLERVILTWYQCEVRQPPVPKKRLAIDQGRLREDVRHDCKRAKWLLDKFSPNE